MAFPSNIDEDDLFFSAVFQVIGRAPRTGLTVIEIVFEAMEVLDSERIWRRPYVYERHPFPVERTMHILEVLAGAAAVKQVKDGRRGDDEMPPEAIRWSRNEAWAEHDSPPREPPGPPIVPPGPPDGANSGMGEILLHPILFCYDENDFASALEAALGFQP